MFTPDKQCNCFPEAGIRAISGALSARRFAVALSMAAGPFPTFLASIWDNAPTGSTVEANGPNGCTYEPTSNTGVVIVRHLVNNPVTDPPSTQTYSILDSGILP